MAEMSTVTLAVELVSGRSIRVYGAGQDATYEFDTRDEARAAMRRVANVGLDLIEVGTAVEMTVNPVLNIVPKPAKGKEEQQG